MRLLVPLFALQLRFRRPALAAETFRFPTFSAIELRGGGIVTIVPGPAQRVTILEGARQITACQVDREGSSSIDTCKERCPPVYGCASRSRRPRCPVWRQRRRADHDTEGFPPQNEIVGSGQRRRQDRRPLDGCGQVSAAVNGGGELLVRPRASYRPRSMAADMCATGAIRRSAARSRAAARSVAVKEARTTSTHRG